MAAHKFTFGPLVWFVGVVEDRVNDPKKLGRVKVRIYGYHSSSKSDIPTNDLMWALVGQPTTSAAISGVGESPSGIVEGSTVYGWFLDGEDAQTPLIIGTLAGAPVKTKSSAGFSDPNGVYPKYNSGESDVNRHARGESGTTSEKTKKANQIKGVKPATGGQGSSKSWDQPDSPYAPQYPYNHVRETESGLLEEFDDTKGHERIHRFHKSGTFEETGPDGTKVTQVVKDNYTLVSGDDYVDIKGDVNINISGNIRLQVNGTTYLTTNGDVNQQVDGDMNIKVGGNLKLDVSGNYTNTAGGVNTTKASTIFLN